MHCTPSIRKNNLTIFILSLLVFSANSMLFGRNRLDTLEAVNAAVTEKKFSYAAKLLDSYCRYHNNDFNGIWLYAQIEYWLKNFAHSRQLYETAMKLQTTNAYLQLDYARMLINTGRYRQAQQLLLQLKAYDVTREAAMYDLAKSYFWQRNNAKAKREATQLTRLHATDESKKLLNDISFVAAPWIKLSSGFTSDSQPLQVFSQSVEMGVSPHCFLSPYFGYYRPTFFFDGNVLSASWFTLGNKFYFGRGPEIQMEVGTVRLPFQNTQVTTSKFYAKQKLGKYVAFDLVTEHKPYFNTLRSIDTIVTVNHFFSSIELNKPGGAIAKLAFDNNHFAEGNNVYSLFAYVVAKPIKIASTELRFGYSYTFNDSKENRFVPKDSFSEILAKGYPIAGVYSPYFTPQHQVINSLIGSWQVPIGKAFRAGINSNVAIYATTLNPYFYLQKKPPNTYVIYKDYATLRYVPWDVSCYVQWRPSPAWTLRADYQYRSTFFFQSNYAGLTINRVLFHEQK